VTAPASRAGWRVGSGNPGRPRRSLVTGGAGFIGSHLTDLLLARGDIVVVVDDLSTGRRENLAGARRSAGPGRLRVIEADLARTLDGGLANECFDEVYHMAAAVGVRRIMQRPIESIETNVVQTAAVLRFVAGHRQRGAAMPATLVASSSEVYGKSAKTPFSEEDDCVYGPTTAVRWSYAATKAIDEYLALAWRGSVAMPVVVVRFFNTVGPRQVGDYGMVLPNFISAALAGEPLAVHGDGLQTRTFCDVRDAAPALLRLLAEPACHGRVFNLGSDRTVGVRELAEVVVRTLGSSSAIRQVPYDEAFPAVGGAFEDLRHRRPDLQRIREAIGFEAKIPIEQTIRDIAETLERRGVAVADRDGNGGRA